MRVWFGSGAKRVLVPPVVLREKDYAYGEVFIRLNSCFLQNGYRPMMKSGMNTSQVGKHRGSSYEIPGGETGEEESLTDFTKNELLLFKTGFAKPKFANTYRMEPYKKCQAHIVRRKAEDILKNKLQDFLYIGINGASTCTALSADLLAGVKELGFDRYKFIVQVFLVQKTGQSIHIASRWVWDVKRDTWVQGQYETENYVVVAVIVACYYE